jgi:hypothetical protein
LNTDPDPKTLVSFAFVGISFNSGIYYVLCVGNENWDDEGLENTPIIEGIDNSYAHIVPVGQTFKPDKRGVKVHFLPPFALLQYLY